LAVAHTLGELAAYVNGTLKGDADCLIRSVASLQSATEGDITFLASKHYLKNLAGTSATAVVIAEEYIHECPVAAIISQNPHLAFTKISQLLNPGESAQPGIHCSAVIDTTADVHASACISANSVVEKNATIGEGVYIGPGCVIGEGAVIGTNVRLVAGVTICAKSVLGERVIAHPGVVIGADGFGLSNDNGVWLKVPQLGNVIIGNDVEIGANTTIDRGTMDDTVIGNGVKIDNQVQIAHNVVIGENTAIAGCVGIAGSACIGAGCTIGGGVGILGHISIADNVHVTAMSFVTRSLDVPGVYSSGTPLQENREWHRNYVRLRRLDDMAKRLKRLEKIIASLDKE
jgi:UDP-3-O-[3-hydroxymyristoyl] glucosamine N-acyltransferase